MRLFNGFCCFLCGSLAVLLYVGPANRDRHVKAALAPLDAIAAFAHSDAALASPELRTALADPNTRDPVADPVIKVPLAEPEVNASPLEASDECVLSEECIDQYLWSVYERARKVDTIKVEERIKVKVEKNGKSRTVTKTVTKFVNEDFTWKDPNAAEKAGMSVAQYVIGGMDRAFKGRLYHLFRALDDAGLAPGMTSGFRDDYRQSITSGHKAATGNSYHGGSRRGGYGHGLAADVVSVKGDTRAERCSSSERMWKWIDAHGKEFGIGRPYLDKDPPHIAPIDGQEYADKRGVNPKLAEKGGTATGLAEQLLRAPDAKAANRSKISFIGGWGGDVAECRDSPITITARRAEGFGVSCEFHSSQRESSNGWRMRAKCSSNTERWNANIRLTVSTSKLTWSSERGTTTYVRCPVVSASR